MRHALGTSGLTAALPWGLLVGGLVVLGATAPALGQRRLHDWPASVADTGHLVGGIVYRGRAPSGSNNRYQPGVVHVWRGGHVVATRRVRRDRKFHFRLTPGRYTIVAHVRWGDCPQKARVKPDQTTNQNVYCVFH